MKKEKLDETVTMTEKLGANQKIGIMFCAMGISICIIQIQ